MSLFDDCLHERLHKVMIYVAATTTDQWARDYLLQRLEDLGFDRHPNFIRDDKGHYQRIPTNPST